MLETMYRRASKLKTTKYVPFENIKGKNKCIEVYHILSEEFDLTYGRSKYIAELANYLITQGFNVIILHRMGKVIANLDIFSEVYRLGSETTSSFKLKGKTCELIGHLPNPFTVFISFFKLLKYVRRKTECQKIIHVHDISSSFIIGLAVGKLYGIPVILHIHGFPVKEQFINITHTKSRFTRVVWFLTKMLHHVAVKILSKSASPIAYVIVNNNEVQSFYEKYGVDYKKIRVIPSAISLEDFENKLLPRDFVVKILGTTSPEEFVIGYVGRLAPEKNLVTLLQAFNRFINSNPEARVKLVLVGDGPLKSLLINLISRYGLRRHVILAGRIPNAFRLLKGIDVFVLPSFSEGSPVSLLEAMAAERAIIASNIPAIREIVEDGEEALLFNPHNHQQLENLIFTLYNNPKLREKLGENARRKAKQYDVNVIFPKIIQIYKKVSKSSANSNSAKRNHL